MVLAPGPIPIFLARIDEQLFEYFNDKGAVSSKNAISVNISDLKSYLETPELLILPLEKYRFIIKTKENKYYLNIEVYKRNIKIFKLALGLIIVLFIATVLSPIFINYIRFMFNW
jgi:hypothetical protein